MWRVFAFLLLASAVHAQRTPRTQSQRAGFQKTPAPVPPPITSPTVDEPAEEAAPASEPARYTNPNPPVKNQVETGSLTGAPAASSGVNPAAEASAKCSAVESYLGAVEAALVVGGIGGLTSTVASGADLIKKDGSVQPGTGGGGSKVATVFSGIGGVAATGAAAVGVFKLMPDLKKAVKECKEAVDALYNSLK